MKMRICMRRVFSKATVGFKKLLACVWEQGFWAELWRTDQQMDGQMDGRTDKPSYRDVCHIKKLIKSNPPSKKVSPLISCQSWHLFKKILFFWFFAIFTPIYGSLSHARLYEIFNNFCYTRVYALIFFATASVCHGLTFYEKKKGYKGGTC